MDGLLMNKTAVVTGASSGIGAGIARVMAREGAALVITYRRNGDGMRRMLDELRAQGATVHALQSDISRVEEIAPMIEEAVRILGRLDVLVNNAGTTARCPFMDVTPEIFETIMGTNMRGTYFCAQAAARVMIRQRAGRIINISTFQTKNVTMNSSVYTATKSAIDRMTEAMALELAPYNIQVNAINPGCIPVESEPPMSENDRRDFVRYIPYGRFGLAEDVGEAAAFLASDRCRFTTGARLVVDGGQSVPLHFPPRKEEEGA